MNLHSPVRRSFSSWLLAIVVCAWLCCALAIDAAARPLSISTQTVQVSISPTYVIVQLGQQQTFTATVTGTGNTTVTWQVDSANGGNPVAGTISSSGVYTAPTSLPNVASATVTAVSQADPSKSATAVITLVTQPATGTTYYVATTGSDSNPGTIDKP